MLLFIAAVLFFFASIAIGGFLVFITYKKGFEDALKVMKPTVVSSKNEISVTSNKESEKTHEKKSKTEEVAADPFLVGFQNIMAYDGTPQTGTKETER